MQICEICRNSDILCQACQKKLEAGEINQLEVDTARILNKIKEDASFNKIIELDNLVVIITDDPSILIGKGGKNVKQLENKLNKKVKNTSNIKELSKEILRAPIIGINIKYAKNDEEYIIRVNEKYKARLKKNIAILQKISKRLFNKKINVKFE